MACKIGVKEGLIIRGTRDEVKIAEKMAKYFYISFSKNTKFKEAIYTFNFLKTGGKLKSQFNLANELLLVFSNYNEFDNRSLDFVDKTLFEFNNRLDKICILLVSRDINIESKIEKLNRENKESKIIIPFTYNEILKTNFDNEYLENKFRNYFYSRDLFAVESPLKSENYFYGRIQTVQEFYNKYCLGEHGGLFGLRKIGKTSVLYGLQRMIDDRNGVSIYIDCQDTGIHKSRWNEVLFFIIKEIKARYSLELDTGEKETYTEKDCSELFEKHMKMIQEQLNGQRILIIFDEIEHISFQTSSTNHWREELDYVYFWQTLRAIYQKNNELFSFIIAGVNPLSVEQPNSNGYDNPIFSLINPIYLELFNMENVSEMVSSIGNYMGLTFDEEIYARLTDDYGGHPFLIRHICSLINADIKGDRPVRVKKYLYKDQKEKYDMQVQGYVEMIISVLSKWYPKEYQLLELLVKNEKDLFLEEIKLNTSVITHLQGYGIIKKYDGNYYITISAVEKYISKNIKHTPALSTIEEKWQEISKRRNSLEKQLRSIILTIYKLNFGIQLKSEILKCFPKHEREKLKDIELAEIISDKLLFSQLIVLITKKWTLFEKILIDKKKFEMYMGFINKYRIDAHAKDITEDNLAALIIAFDWMGDVLKDIV